MPSCWQPEIDQDENIYGMEMSKNCTSELLPHPSPFPSRAKFPGQYMFILNPEEIETWRSETYAMDMPCNYYGFPSWSSFVPPMSESFTEAIVSELIVLF
jgi:hypothetical protein